MQNYTHYCCVIQMWIQHLLLIWSIKLLPSNSKWKLPHDEFDWALAHRYIWDQYDPYVFYHVLQTKRKLFDYYFDENKL